MPLIIGWAALTIAVLVPLSVSLIAIVTMRDLHCSEGFSYTFSPMLLTCGTRDLGVLAIGWTLTTATVAGLAVAVAIAIVAAVRSHSEKPAARARSELWTFVATVMGVLATTGAVLASNPDLVWGSNSWIFFAAAGSFLVLALGAIIATIASHVSSSRTRA
ncbi:hypothetical protein [Microbacterium sp. 22242]|uniref:hypothetical protein n=1 Tax=Microbacterium sp. 22242 TaxID=3453896 RepID=UPI003F84E789